MITVEKTKWPKTKPVDESTLGFGAVFSDHMFVMKYEEGLGWHDAKIVPYGPISIMPTAMCLHYGQEVFEGMKAYRGEDDSIYLFRPEENIKRLERSCQRVCIPPLPGEVVMEGLKQLVELDSEWVPHIKDASLYIRPFVIATEAKLGVKASNSYDFYIVLSPSGPYYATGLDPVRIYVEEHLSRAAKGGTGEAKTAGNYAASLLAGEQAHAAGYSQVLWLDSAEKKYVEEVGAMNIFFVIDDTVITPALSGSILPGITRKSAIEILRHWGVKVQERQISIDEVLQAGVDGRLKEVFGTGTAAVISPVGELKVGDNVLYIGDGKTGPLSKKLYDYLTDLQWGRGEDPFDWRVKVK